MYLGTKRENMFKYLVLSAYKMSIWVNILSTKYVVQKSTYYFYNIAPLSVKIGETVRQLSRHSGPVYQAGGAFSS
jgi:hypothetical protein